MATGQAKGQPVSRTAASPKADVGSGIAIAKALYDAGKSGLEFSKSLYEATKGAVALEVVVIESLAFQGVFYARLRIRNHAPHALVVDRVESRRPKEAKADVYLLAPEGFGYAEGEPSASKLPIGLTAIRLDRPIRLLPGVAQDIYVTWNVADVLRRIANRRDGQVQFVYEVLGSGDDPRTAVADVRFREDWPVPVSYTGRN